MNDFTGSWIPQVDLHCPFCLSSSSTHRPRIPFFHFAILSITWSLPHILRINRFTQPRMQHSYSYMSEESDDFRSAWMTIVTASHCTLIGSSHRIPPIAFVVMTGSHHESDNDDWQSAQMLLQSGQSCDDCMDVIWGTIVMAGSHHGNNSDDWHAVSTTVASTWRVVMTGSHHRNDNDDWQSAAKVCPAPLPRSSTLRILVFREGSK